MGHNKFQDTLKSGSPSVDVSLMTALSIVTQYRGTYSNIPILWARMKDLLFNMISPRDYGTEYGPLKVGPQRIELPNGMSLSYPDLRYTDGEFIYTTQKGIVRTYGPRLAENVIQALARIVITDQMLEVHALPEVDVVLQVHDEIIALGSKLDSDVTMEKILNIMKTPPSWCKDLPLDAEGGVSQVYDK